MTDYQTFLETKQVTTSLAGISVEAAAINPALFPFQRDTVIWALARARAAMFLDTGLGKTLAQLEWARHVVAHTGGNVLILAPLAVADQTVREGAKFGISVNHARRAADIRPGVNITNYERLHLFEDLPFAGVVLDESSTLKSYMGKTKRQLIERFADTPFRLCCTATPAPNDHVEIGNHAEFLGVMESSEMLGRWFINDTMHMGVYRLKGHAKGAFWDWVASWAVSMRHPRDLGYEDDRFDLPPLNLEQITVPVNWAEQAGPRLFRMADLNATEMHKEMRITAPARADAVADLVNNSDQTWVVWCHTNYESDALMARIPGALEVRGSESPDEKERKLVAFSLGKARVIVTKPSIAGFGLNWQHAQHVAFVGLSYSFEQFYQAVRRTYRFGQTKPVYCYIVAAETEGQILSTVRRKMAAHEEMMSEMRSSSARLTLAGDLQRPQVGIEAVHQGKDWTLYHGDCVEAVRELPTAGVDFTVFSPPFSSLYTYSDALEDMGNSADDEEFFRHFDFLIPELLRVTRPGRLCAVHCKQLVNYKSRDGMAGLRDFRGEIIRHFTAAGWAYHSEVVIWKDPVTEMHRTKAHGLLYKQLRADSTFSRQGLAEYLLVFRRWAADEDEATIVAPVTHTKDDFPLPLWQRYASPVWFDINQQRVLNVAAARDDKDEKHLCPLQLDVIERALELWSNPGDLVLSPFAGIGSEGVTALQMQRRFVGAELKASYVNRALRNLRDVEGSRQATLFDLAEVGA